MKKSGENKMVFNNRKELEKVLAEMEFSKKKSEIYLQAYDKGVNIYPYLKKDIKTGRLRQILIGLSQGVDVSFYDEYEIFHQDQMKVIREGLLLGLDVSWYAKPEYNAHQMTVIKAGLEKGLNVSTYADYRLSDSQMWQFFNRMRRDDVSKVSKSRQHNFGRFNLSDFEFQTVDFEGIVQECKIISPYKYAILVKQLFWQGEYVCDHVWINSTTQRDRKITDSKGFDFGDTISFSAEIEPYYHSRDKQKHYGLCRMSNVVVIENARLYHNYRVGHKLYVRIADVYFYDKEKKETNNAEVEFRKLYDIDESIEELSFEFIGYKKDELIFQISYEETLIKTKGIYNPYNGKGMLKVGSTYYFFSLGDLKSKKNRKLENTFFQAKYLGMIDDIV